MRRNLLRGLQTREPFHPHPRKMIDGKLPGPFSNSTCPIPASTMAGNEPFWCLVFLRMVPLVTRCIGQYPPGSADFALPETCWPLNPFCARSTPANYEESPSKRDPLFGFLINLQDELNCLAQTYLELLGAVTSWGLGSPNKPLLSP